MYETTSQPLAPKSVFYSRLRKNFFYMCMFISICLAWASPGYHYLADIPWLDSLHNSSMILSGMGTGSRHQHRCRKIVFFFLRDIQRCCFYHEHKFSPCSCGASFLSQAPPGTVGRT
jgi:hypothetical protein